MKQSEFFLIDQSVAADSTIQKAVQQWLDVGFAGFKQLGFDPKAKVATVTDALDGLEASVRNGSTKLTHHAPAFCG